MSLHRFVLPPEAFRGDEVIFSREASRQMHTVLRLHQGDRVITLDGSGTEFVTTLTALGREARGAVEERRVNTSEPRTMLVLYQALLKGTKLDMVVQRCTEVGVRAIVPVTSERCVSLELSIARRQRLETIAREAVEQSRRGRVPTIGEPVPFGEAVRQAAVAGTVIVPWEEERSVPLSQVSGTSHRPVGLFIGPEGGFSGEEITRAREEGAQPVSLGPRTLRSETAAIVGCALILARMGDLG